MSLQSGPPTRTTEPRHARPGAASLRVMAYPDLFLRSREGRAAGGSPIFVERLPGPPYISPRACSRLNRLWRRAFCPSWNEESAMLTDGAWMDLEPLIE